MKKLNVEVYQLNLQASSFNLIILGQLEKVLVPMFRLKKVHFRNKTFYYLNEREGKLSITVLSSTNLITDQYFAGSFSCCPVVREEVKC